MPYQRTLKPGNLVTIGASKAVLLVVRSERKVSRDETRGESYSVGEISVVDTGYESEIPPVGGLRPMIAPVEKAYYFEGGSMRGEGTCIKDSDVTVIGTSALTKRITTTYEIGKVELFWRA
jgi:hypothetical protein